MLEQSSGTNKEGYLLPSLFLLNGVEVTASQVSDMDPGLLLPVYLYFLPFLFTDTR